MPNRIIKESICRSDTIDSLSWFEEVLFYRLIVVCDDFGRFDGRPAIIKGACFPLKDDVTKAQINGAIEKLSTAGLVRGYEFRGRSYLQLTTWDCHQQIRAKNSKYPSPDIINDKNSSSDISCNHMISHDINGNQQISDDSKCYRESRNENRETRIENRESARTMGRVCRFEEFWSVYPSKQRRHLAETAYCELVSSGTITEEDLVNAAKNYAKHIKNSGSRSYLPNNFLEKCVFEDYLETKPEPQPKQKESDPEEEEELVGDDWMNYGPGWRNRDV